MPNVLALHLQVHLSPISAADAAKREMRTLLRLKKKRCGRELRPTSPAKVPQLVFSSPAEKREVFIRGLRKMLQSDTSERTDTIFLHSTLSLPSPPSSTVGLLERSALNPE
ncbi:unnamed protein product [Pleuronectes platessa]|uniref:Uncharacterized protein n=1 Tax=Pleuronectes platessa TaxID=8262 RepID=A0A9N7VC50_PLEPL|nr:unnamed protein product [Pleuronectes platessa]